MLSPTMVWRSLSTFMGMAFAALNIVPRNQIVIVRCCTKTLNITTKPLSFQNKQIMVFMLCLMLVISSATKGVSIELHKFWFCYDDLLHCVGRTNKKYALDTLILPSLWPNLT
jgi:hypothetical protein